MWYDEMNAVTHTITVDNGRGKESDGEKDPPGTELDGEKG